MSFLLSILSTLTFVTSRVEWLSTQLDIRLHENKEEYIEIPQAKLYLDDVLTEDPFVFYERNGVERTFISIVNTSVVKTYQVKYRVTFPTYNVSSVQTIYFNVIDDIPPIIHQVPSFKIALTQNIPDLSLGFYYSDNYDSQDKLSVEIDSSRIVKSKIGRYQIIYRVTDSSGNQTIGTGSLEIFDPIPPDITLKNPLIISVGSQFTYQDFLIIKDNYDLVVNVVIDDQLVDYQRLGTYRIIVTATDQSGNESRLQLDLKIIDDVAPTISLKTSPKPITVYQEITQELLLSFVLLVSDNYDDLTFDDLSIYHDIDIERLGTYTIVYTLYDLSLNKSEVKLSIKVIDDIAPLITILEPFIYDVYSPFPYFIDLIDIFDNYDKILKSAVKITASPKMNMVGIYPITIEVKDFSGNTSYHRDYIYIVDRIPPEITQVSEIMITDFSKRSFLSYFETSDQYDQPSDLTIEIDDHQVIYDQVGSYTIFVSVKDSSGNMTSIETSVIIVDVIEPTLSLTHQQITISMGSTHLVLRDFIKEASDNYDELSQEDVAIDHQINYEKIGVYKITYTLKDKSLNQNMQILTLKIDDMTPPIISAHPLTIKTNQTFDPFEGVTVIDDTSYYVLKCFPETLDTSSPGIQVVTYIATDQRGNYTKIERLITIEKEEVTLSLDQYLPLAIITLISFSACYYFWKKL